MASTSCLGRVGQTSDRLAGGAPVALAAGQISPCSGRSCTAQNHMHERFVLTLGFGKRPQGPPVSGGYLGVQDRAHAAAPYKRVDHMPCNTPPEKEILLSDLELSLNLHLNLQGRRGEWGIADPLRTGGDTEAETTGKRRPWLGAGSVTASASAAAPCMLQLQLEPQAEPRYRSQSSKAVGAQRPKGQGG